MLDLEALQAALERHGPVTRVVIAETRGSAPRGAGTEMLVAEGGLVSGTIGGGALEYQAIEAARRLAAPRVDRQALGPDLGQCCGGAVTLVFDRYETLPQVENSAVLRRIDGPADPTLAVRRAWAGARNGARPPRTELVDGWLIEPVAHARVPLWVWGAGHVGRAIVTTLAPLPRFAVTWIDTAAERFPAEVPPGVTTVPAARPERLAVHAPKDAVHLILTYSHALDLAICDALLRRGCASAGLIGSESKWARFRSRLSAMGHATARIDGITCPIGDPALGKHPQEIAVGVAARLLRDAARQDAERDMTG
ncbi:xanthine dehydrogenase accessory factor [Pseudooceanicola batsensis HTCC2597]|uniref:Xanthine dehydrogenase accessory factor n=1 Tax=Pseudooceanicola batsensis (strain ATCC BAA-863 / DSM 15984 / KCTC 12145 / HTCC2597) TaxID=252305 RepID=A3TUZ2_PSEBH|nr:xanthine dehydrogenase accessory protein XdhC [Pseudooceanicola batsensis]EAQ04338.1 xanthine dehydrogenase accessory factor [Pseudooceanicola batsensis HTCC2597]